MNLEKMIPFCNELQNIENYIPFIQKIEEPVDGFVKVEGTNIRFYTYGRIADRAIYLAGATFLIPFRTFINIAAIVHKTLQIIAIFYENIVHDNFTFNRFKNNIIQKSRQMLEIIIGNTFLQIVSIFGVFFPQNATKLYYSMEKCIYGGANLSSIFYAKDIATQ